jgi:hypothetical protein
MRNAIVGQEKTLIRPGFSPKPESSIIPLMATSPSPSLEPITPSPNALLDAPIIQRSAIIADSPTQPSVVDGIVSFGK